MGAQDLSYWKRFSKAVHLDDVAPYNQPNTGWVDAHARRRPELKHSYDFSLLHALQTPLITLGEKRERLMTD